jgi:ferric-dicitrate binding protein FerR (iron transport regulator)
MTPKAQITLQNFIQGQHLSVAELKELKHLFLDSSKTEEIHAWLAGNWREADAGDLEISYDGLKQKILHYESSQKSHPAFVRPFAQFAGYYQRIAAVLFIPLILGLSVYLFLPSADEVNFYLSEAPLGQKARIELPDGSKVWLNSGSSIRYSSEFNRNDRTVELKGEAFFEVEKNTGKPFFVHTSFLDVKVTGTIFNVNAYSDEPTIETSLLEGSVILLPAKGNKLFQLTPGQVLSFSKSSSVVSTSGLDEEAVVGWKDNRLIFINDDFSKLVRKIEKWYNIEVVYDPDRFKDNKLTVKLLEGEQLPRLLEIIESAIGAKCTMKDSKIIITKIN